MYERLKYLYGEKRITAIQLGVAVSKGWITNVQKEEIINSFNY